MIAGKEIPAWTDRTEDGLRAWWQDMVAQGLAFHPDDAPESIVTVEEGEALFDASACLKLKGLLAEMRLIHGDKVYQCGHEALMESMGWIAGPSGDWVKATTAD